MPISAISSWWEPRWPACARSRPPARTASTGRSRLIGAEPHLPYDRPPLSKAYLDETIDSQAPVSTEFRSESVLRDDLNVDLLLGAPATGLDTTARIVTLSDSREVRYDALVIATGADARTLPGADALDGVHTLRTVDDAIAVRAALDAGARTVVIGAGFIGSEVASAARKRGLSPVVIEALPDSSRSGGRAGDGRCPRVVAYPQRHRPAMRCRSGIDRG